MKYYIITYGCQMNISDSERLATTLVKKGHQRAKTKESANLIVINVCSVKQTAINRAYSQVNNLNKRKEKPAIYVTGCLLEHDRKKLKDRVTAIWPLADLEIPAKCSSKVSAYLPIMTGCNNFCSYCAVPYTRGREVSRSAQAVISDAKKLTKQGFKEIVLLGQNVNSYKSERIDFPKLLQQLDKLPGNFQLKFLTSHPKDLSDKLIAVMASSKKIAKELHLPLQSGDNQILKKMNRGYTVTHYKKLIRKIRMKIPDIFISTDIIVGYPSETKKQFENTFTTCQEIKFDKAYISPYSPRPGTQAAKAQDNVDRLEKKRRWLKLEKLIFKKKPH